MKVSSAIAEILKREGIDVIFGHPRNAVLEKAAAIGIRPIMLRQQRTGGFGVRVQKPDAIAPAFSRAIAATRARTATLLDFASAHAARAPRL